MAEAVVPDPGPTDRRGRLEQPQKGLANGGGGSEKRIQKIAQHPELAVVHCRRPDAMAKGPTPEQKFKKLFDLSWDQAATQGERDAAQRQCHVWLKRHGRKPIDVSAILAQAERDDERDAKAAQPPPPAAPQGGAAHVFDDPKHDPATLIEMLARQYLVMEPHVRVIYVVWIVATHIYDQFRIAPRVLLTSEEPNAGKTTALEFARCLIFRANVESAGTAAAIRDHLNWGPGSIALDETDLQEPAARQALLLLWNLGHTRGAKRSMMAGGQKKLFNLYAPMIAAGLGDVLGRAQLSRTFKLRMHPYAAEEKPEFDWWAPASEGPNSDEDRKKAFDTFYDYLRHCAATWKLNLQPPMPPGIMRRSADNLRSLFAVADACGGEWPRRAREAAVVLLGEMSAEQPSVLILSHGLTLFERFETDTLEINHFNRELRNFGAPEFDWNAYRGASGLDNYPHPITISEQGRLLTSAGVKSHTKWAPGVTRARRGPGDCQRVYKSAEFAEALRRATSESGGKARTIALRLIKPSSD